MSLEIKITEVHGRQILDSRGNPTVEVEVTAQREDNGIKFTGRESVPSGASTGRFEAIELRDGALEYFGLGVQKVVEHINGRIRNELLGMNVLEQTQIDRRIVELDEPIIKEIWERTRCLVSHLPARGVQRMRLICHCIAILVERMRNAGRCRR